MRTRALEHGMLRTAGAVIGAAGLLAAAGPATASGAASVPAGSCVQMASGTATLAAGGLTTRRTFTSSGTSVDYACSMPDPTATSAKEVWSQTGTAVCLPVVDEQASGTDTWTWSNGRTSVMTYTDQLDDDVDITMGTFISGEFAGMTAHWAGFGSLPSGNPLGTIPATGSGLLKWCALGQSATIPSGYSGIALFS